jgi:hypothetical protein
MNVDLILYVVAAVCFAIAAFGVPAGRINLIAAGLFFYTLAAIV